MRYFVYKAGQVVSPGQHRPTVSEALSLALAMLDEAGDGEFITLADNEAGERYSGREQILGLRRALEKVQNA